MTNNKKRGRGRPKLVADERRTHIKQVRLNNEELEAVEAAAHQKGKVLGEWMREILLAASKKSD